MFLAILLREGGAKWASWRGAFETEMSKKGRLDLTGRVDVSNGVVGMGYEGLDYWRSMRASSLCGRRWWESKTKCTSQQTHPNRHRRRRPGGDCAPSQYQTWEASKLKHWWKAHSPYLIVVSCNLVAIPTASEPSLSCIPIATLGL